MDICEKYGTCQSGLDDAEAERRRGLYGENVLQKKKPPSLARRFVRQLKDPMLIILLGAAAVGLVLAATDFTPSALFEPLLITGIVAMNALLSAVQERSAQRSLDALGIMSATKCKVRREGKERIIDARELVPGDVVLLHAGDVVPADCVLTEAHSLSGEESMLTGESIPVSKSEGDTVYSGCRIITGSGCAVADATGMSTEMGRIAALLDGTSERYTPLQEKLKKLSEQLGVISLVICFVVFALGLAGIYILGNRELTVMTLLMTAVALAVSALPEGLPTTVTLVLSAGMKRLVAKKAVVRKLPAVETLGSVSVICTDKTGTLTTGKMTVTEYTDERTLTLAALCTDNASDPTDAAILERMPRPDCVRLSVTPFDNTVRRMTVVVRYCGQLLEINKGAAESVCRGATDAAAVMEKRGLRVLAVTYRVLRSPDDLGGGEATFAGLIGLSDPPRPEAAEAVAKCVSAGIRPIMLTGDGAGAARSTALAVGLNAEEVLTGADIERMTDDELTKKLKTVSVFARVTPSDKLRVVKLLRAAGEVVGVTGDGVNDAPALRTADIGCAMGSGTEVAKAEADIVLTDDNFATVVDAVETGRGVFGNIRKAVAFLLGTNIGEVVAVVLAMVLTFDSPLLSMQLLWINLVSDSLPAIALGSEKTPPDVMTRKPLGRGEGIFAKGMLVRLVLHGLLFGALCLTAFYVTRAVTGDLAAARTACFLTLGVSQILHAYNLRSDKPLFTLHSHNRLLNISSAAGLALVAFAVMIPPVATAFAMKVPSPLTALFCLALAVIPLIVDESVKLFLYFRSKKSACLRERRALRARGVTDAAYGEIPTPVGHDAHTAR